VNGNYGIINSGLYIHIYIHNTHIYIDIQVYIIIHIHNIYIYVYLSAINGGVLMDNPRVFTVGDKGLRVRHCQHWLHEKTWGD
jgi:hypothetical protein